MVGDKAVCVIQGSTHKVVDGGGADGADEAGCHLDEEDDHKNGGHRDRVFEVSAGVG
jgi:hypothetical protein